MPHTLILVALFPDRWQQFQRDFDGSITGRVGQHVIPLETPRPDQIEEILDMRLEPLGVKAVELFAEEDLDQIVRMSSLRSGLNRASAIFEHRVNGVPLPPVPPPPPPPLRLNGNGALSAQPRLLQLEEQIGQILERLERLETSGSGHGQQLAAATVASVPEERQNPERALEPVISDGPRPTAGREIASDNPYADLFRRYRQNTLETLEQRWQKTPIIDESDDAGKLRQICLGYQEIRPLEVEALRLGSRRVPDNVLIKLPKSQFCVAFLHLTNGNAINARLTNLNQLVLRHRQVQFILMRDASAPEIRSKGASAALQAFLNGCGDGVQRTHERPLDSERRLALEFVHQLVSDIINRELDVPLRDGLQLLAQVEPDNWVVRMLHPARRAG
jgi:hypothetical protein